MHLNSAWLSPSGGTLPVPSPGKGGGLVVGLATLHRKKNTLQKPKQLHQNNACLVREVLLPKNP